MIKSEGWFNKWTVGGAGLGGMLREARLSKTGPAWTEALGRSGRPARFYRTHEVMAWKGGAGLVRKPRKKFGYAPDLDLPIGEIGALKRTIEELKLKLAEVESDRRELHRKIQRYDCGPDALGLLSKGEILSMARPQRKQCGVYFLIENNDIVYVGQSTNIDARVASHHGTKAFSYVAHVECPQNHLNPLEALYISKFSPPLNGRGGGQGQDETAAIEYELLLGKDWRI